MYFEFGHPELLSGLTLTCPELRDLKKNNQIAIIDDRKFLMAKSLQSHGFQLTELGGDIRSVEQVNAYPIVICDIKGVGKSFGSPHEGAHVLAEIRKSYPDKFLITYSGSEYDVSFNESLISADASATKDADVNYWVSTIERGLRAVGDPKERWLRFRRTLVNKGIDAYDLFKLESAFVKSIKNRKPSEMAKVAIPDEVREIVKIFAGIALHQIIESLNQ